MIEKLFGTDGIRGEANTRLTPELAVKVGEAAGIHFRRDKAGHRHRVLIGKDTRLSCYMIEQSLTAGFLSAGVNVLLTGPIPTPGVAALTRSMRADIGVMITASHNLYKDNGIKLFGPDGFKLSDKDEKAIEMLAGSDCSLKLATGADMGRAQRIEGVDGRYVEIVKRIVPAIDFDGLRVVIDCANGAGYKVAPLAFEELGAEVFLLGVEPNGLNINEGCGSTEPKKLQAEVCRLRADIGIALDGDADRVVIVDEKGALVDGDQIVALIATKWRKQHRLKKGVVGTRMTNGGLERYLNSMKIPFHRAEVGDRYVLEMMRKEGCVLGGEQSGHIIMSEHATTGDGLMAALQVVSILKQDGRKMSELAHCFTPVPQVLKNIRAPKELLTVPGVQEAIHAAEGKLGTDGRLLVRASGTEPLIRLMAEHPDSKLIGAVLESLECSIAKARY
jgi:phosphoglucosamine mutase